MQQRRLKLKQASAVLKVEPKELQNLVQFGVVKPKRVEGTYLFDRETLLTAKVAFRLKESLGTRANVLSKFIDVFRASAKGLRAKNPEYVIFTCRFAEEEPIKNCRRESIALVYHPSAATVDGATAALRRSNNNLNSSKFSFDD